MIAELRFLEGEILDEYWLIEGFKRESNHNILKEWIRSRTYFTKW